ncbi:palmitoyl-protein thioesterase [Trichodelitschia bisporula]|uniref:Palmitoyl-protein thioesterase 1 n=1 Tax=Trichodelitschia bisporula TaxID=703511 RepID=A0A6G1I0Y9_9PEZI|nr:palmitoyl-protein thioesterase [Trichodelitschia bisporula]
MRSSLTLLLSAALALAAPTPPEDDTPLPVLIWHGLGDTFNGDGIKQIGELIDSVHEGTLVYPIGLDPDPNSDRTASWFGNTTQQIAQVCAELAAHPILSTAPAVDALGFSQGGIFLRAYVERCNFPPVRNLVTFGTPHNGISEFQACATTDWMCKGAMALLKMRTWSSFVQNRLVPAQYYRTVDPETGNASEEYLEYSNLLADINNEREVKNETYKKNIASLNKLVMFQFSDDVTVVPRESEWFAEVNGTTRTVFPLKDRPIYKEDWLGLKKLDEKDGLEFRIAPGKHMQLSDKVLKAAFKEYFGPLKASSKAPKPKLDL